MSSVLRLNMPAGAEQLPDLLRPLLAPLSRKKQLCLALPLLLLLWFFLPKPVSALETFTLTGQILDIDAKPVTGAELFVYDSAVIRRPADFISARSGKDGRFSLVLPRQKYWAVARVRSSDKFGPLLPGDRHSGEPLILEPDETAELIQDFTVVDIREAVRQKQKIRSDFLSVTGHVVDQYGKPVRDAYAFALSEQAVRGVPDYVSAWTVENGEYTIYLPPGRYFLGVSKKFPPVPGTAAKQELLLTSGKSNKVQDLLIAQEQPSRPALSTEDP